MCDRFDIDAAYDDEGYSIGPASCFETRGPLCPACQDVDNGLESYEDARRIRLAEQAEY